MFVPSFVTKKEKKLIVVLYVFDRGLISRLGLTYQALKKLLSHKWMNHWFLLGEISKSDEMIPVLSGYTPLSLWGASLHPTGSKRWTDVGGLRHVKEALTESLLWPGKVINSKTRFFSGKSITGGPSKSW